MNEFPAENRARIRRLTLLSLIVTIPLGFIFKYYQGPAQGWFNNYGAGVFYEIFWILALFLIWLDPKGVDRIPLWVFAVTSLLEFLQLWSPPLLVQIRATFLGAVLLGDSFSWWDFPHYGAGCIFGWLWLKKLRSS